MTRARSRQGTRRVVMLVAALMLLLSAVGCQPNVERLLRQGDMDGLIEALHHEDAEIRRDALLALGELGGRAGGRGDRAGAVGRRLDGQ